jgi:uncharacterized protein (DUF433 family)
MPDPSIYIKMDEHGVLRVGNSRVMIDSVIAAFRNGHSPEAIRSQYPALRLEEVYGAITYCLAHVLEIDAYLNQQNEVWQREKARTEQTPPPVVNRLRATHGAATEKQ